MRFNVHDAPQRSDAWFAARLGKLTGSRAADMLATIKRGEAAARRDYRLQIACERLTGQSQDEGFSNAAMERGTQLEPVALAAYEVLTGSMAHTSGFLSLPDVMAGCSLDGQIDNFAGILEIKAPKSATHLRYVRGGVLPAEYLPQVTHNLWVTGAAWCDFLSFDDRFPAGLQTFLVRVLRADLDITGYEKSALEFLEEVQTEVDAINTMTRVAA